MQSSCVLGVYMSNVMYNDMCCQAHMLDWHIDSPYMAPVGTDFVEAQGEKVLLVNLQDHLHTKFKSDGGSVCCVCKSGNLLG